MCLPSVRRREPCQPYMLFSIKRIFLSLNDTLGSLGQDGWALGSRWDGEASALLRKMPPEGWATQGRQAGSPGPGRRVWLGQGWAGLGLSCDFNVRLIFKDRVGLEENILLAVGSSGEQQCQACRVSHNRTIVFRLLLKTCIYRCVSFVNFRPETKNGQKAPSQCCPAGSTECLARPPCSDPPPRRVWERPGDPRQSRRRRPRSKVPPPGRNVQSQPVVGHVSPSVTQPGPPAPLMWSRAGANLQ